MLARSIRATDEEKSRSLPGDQFVKDAIASITHAITINQRREDVWPWLVQMGAGRAGWYSYDFVDNGGRPSARRIIPELQNAEVGTLFPAVPGATDCFFALALEHDHWLVLGWVPKRSHPPVTTWTIFLEEPSSRLM